MRLRTPSSSDVDASGNPRGSVNYDYGGLSHWQVSVYAQELAIQIGFALRGLRHMRAAIARHDALEAFAYVQALLAASALVSQILWPSSYGTKGKPAVKRGKALRDAFGITAGSSVLESRPLRDHFMHFDSRLDDWTHERSGLYVDANLGDPTTSGFPAEQILRNLDPPDMTVTFRGDSLSLLDLESELRQLAQHLAAQDWQLHISAFRVAGEQDS